MKATKKILALSLVLMMALSCMAPALAASTGRFTYTRNGQTHEMSMRILDAEGNPVLTRDVTVPAGGSVIFGENDGGPIYLESGEVATATITLASAAPLEIGYEMDSGSYHRLMRTSAAKTVHSATLEVSESGDYYFRIKNISTSSIVMTNAQWDISRG